jgi:2-iminobutanoate/2-iminopropanoate deaminase
MKTVPFTAAAVPLSAAVEVDNLVFTSGQVAFKDGSIQGDNIQEQTDIIMDGIQAILQRLGLEMANIVKAMVWIVDARYFDAYNAAYQRRLKEPYPARTTVVSALPLPNTLVEIEVIASRISRRH